MIVNVPSKFQPHIRVDYPEGNNPIFEEWLFKSLNGKLGMKERAYLPVFWTSYWVNNDYGNNQFKKAELQDFINNLPRDRKYWTVVQYDDGCLIDFKDLDVMVFNMSGDGYPMPLLCQPHQYQFHVERDIFYSYVGSNTHPIRRHLKQWTNKRLPTKEYCELHARSVFSLCPRGYGINSFRIQEALQYGAIPVYISDKFIFPHNLDFNDFGVVIGEKDVNRVEEILRAIPQEEIKRKQELIPSIFLNYFTYEANRDLILKAI